MAIVTTDPSTGIAHPLDPLDAGEIVQAWKIVRETRARRSRIRVISIALHEPPREVALSHRPGDPIERQAFVVLLDNAARTTYEAVVSLTGQRVLSWTAVPGVQPSIVFDEFVECEAAVRADPRWQQAMRKRGVTDWSLAMIDPWSAGNFGFPGEEGRRLVRALTWVRRHPSDNGYARPVANLLTVVDLDEMKVVDVQDGGVVPLPTEDANYTAETAGSRTDLKPLEIRQPEGPSFVLSGHELTWQRWRMRLGFTPREGLVLHTVTYADQGRDRPILYRRPSSTWSCPTAIRGPPTSTGTPSTSASTGSATSPTRSSWAAIAWARSAMSMPWSTTAGVAPSPSSMPCAFTRRTTGSSGSISTGAPGRARSGARAGWWSRSSPPWATTSMASTGASTRTARSSSR